MLFYEPTDGDPSQQVDTGTEADGEWRGDGTGFGVATSTVSMQNAARLQKMPVYLCPKMMMNDWSIRSQMTGGCMTAVSLSPLTSHSLVLRPKVGPIGPA